MSSGGGEGEEELTSAALSVWTTMVCSRKRGEGSN